MTLTADKEGRYVLFRPAGAPGGYLLLELKSAAPLGLSPLEEPVVAKRKRLENSSLKSRFYWRKSILGSSVFEFGITLTTALSGANTTIPPGSAHVIAAAKNVAGFGSDTLPVRPVKAGAVRQ